MSSEWELDDGIKAIKSAWRREHTARRNLEKMLENAEAENATLRQQLADVTESMGRVEERCAKTFEVGKRWMAKAARFEAENAKLREMVRDMRYCIKRNHRCDDCNFNVGTNCLLFVNINKRMRELGVEVD